jgi:hypothetical protein
MTTHDQLFPSGAIATGEPAKRPVPWVRLIGQRILAWTDRCADYYAAAAMYQQLSALSDSELMRRGLSRATLAHDVSVARDHRPDP